MSKYEKNNIVIVIVVAFLFLLIAGVIYYFYFSDYEEKEKKKESLYIKIIDDSIINELENTIKNNNLYVLARLEKDIDDMNSLESSQKLSMAFPVVSKNIDDSLTIGVTPDLVDEYFKNTFKTTMYWDKTDIYCECSEVLYKYDIESNKYIYNISHKVHDSVNIYPYYSKVLDVKKKNDIYVITFTYVWDKFDGTKDFANNGYASYKDANNSENRLFSLENDSTLDLATQMIEQNYDALKSNLHKYTYVFEKVDNNYLITSFKFTK